MKKLINKIKTNSLEPGEPKDPEGCTLFSIYQAFASSTEVEAMRQNYARGIAWGEMKKHLFEHINDHLAPSRERYEALMKSPEHIEQQLQEGAQKARAVSAPMLQKVRKATGIQPIGA